MENNTRKRGIIASRAKLEAAMLNAGIKTQAALAEKIAESENITTPPKDTINRAFRQEKISPSTLARIAKVLAVDSYTLYLSKKEDDAIQQSEFSKDAITKASRFSPIIRYGFWPGLFILLASIIFWYSQNTSSHKPSSSELTAPVLGRYSIVIDPHSAQSAVLAESIRTIMADKMDSIVVTNESKKGSMSVDLIQQYQADAVIVIRTKNIGRYLAIQLFVYFNGLEKLVWTNSILTVDLNPQKESIALHFKPVLLSFFGYSISDNDSLIEFEDIQTQENYLNARHLLSDQDSEINIKRAQALLNSAIKSYPNFAKAHTALCESYISESWNGNEKQLLEAALSACQKARNLDPTDSYVNATMAWAYRRTGRIPESIAIYTNLLETWPENIDALSGLGNAYLTAYRQELKEYPNALKQANDYLTQATKVEPNFWRHHSDLGISKYTSNDIKGAISSLETSAELHPNELSFVNVGTLNFCQGNLEKAKTLYKKASELAPLSHLGYEFLGTMYYFSGDYKKSAQLRQQALDLINIDGGEYKMWGNLADSYRLSNEMLKAEEAYLKALTIIERDELRGNLEVKDEIHRYYYRLILNEIKSKDQHNDFALSQKYNFESELERAREISSYITLAKIEIIRKNNQNAIKAFEKSILTCPVFSDHPMLKTLLKQENG